MSGRAGEMDPKSKYNLNKLKQEQRDAILMTIGPHIPRLTFPDNFWTIPPNVQYTYRVGEKQFLLIITPLNKQQWQSYEEQLGFRK